MEERRVVEAAPAATVVLLRDGEAGIEVLLGRRSSRLDFHQLRRFLRALRLRLGATWVEAAAAGELAEVGHAAGDGLQAL